MDISPVQITGFIHMKCKGHPNTNKAVCSLDYQYRNKYTRVAKRVTCEMCLAIMAGDALSREEPFAHLESDRLSLLGAQQKRGKIHLMSICEFGVTLCGLNAHTVRVASLSHAPLPEDLYQFA